jgi:RNA polymerase sigma-70 factor (ECF subfamily)
MTLHIPAKGSEQHFSGIHFEDFYNRYWKLLYATALAKTGDHADSVDIVQELFIHIWESRTTLQVNGSMEAYLLTSLRNRILNHFRSQGTREKVRADYARFIDALVSHNTGFIEQETLRNEAEEAVQKALEQLPEKMRYIIIQNKYHHKTIHELSEELNIAPQTVKNQLTKALNRIEYLLKQHHAREITFLLIVFTAHQPTP